MTPDDFAGDAATLCDIAHRFGARGWCRATSGNFSTRVSATHCLVTQSGRDKSRLARDDLMICDLHGNALDAGRTPSAEMPLHSCLYRLDESIGTVLHSHSIHSTLLSMHAGSTLDFAGYEMQKALAGISSHEQEVQICIFANTQDMCALADEVSAAWQERRIRVPGFLVAGHGLYAWGKTAADAERHAEGFEFLLDCRWQEQLAKLI